MKKLFTIICMTVASLSALAAESNRALIQREVLGHTFCYGDNSRAGWIFQKNGTAIQHAVNLGMPGPGNYFKLTFVESLRTVGSFDLTNSHESFHFQLTPNRILIEYQTGRKLSAAACRR